MGQIKVFFFLLLVSKISAQEYTPFVTNGATWINFYSEEYPETEYRAYKIEDDTIINSVIYQKMFMYELGFELTDPLTYSNKNLYGYVREEIDKKRVYGIVNIDNWGEIDVVECDGFDWTDNTKEILLFDFNINIGDTINNCHLDQYERNTIIIKDTIEFMYGLERRVYYNQNDLKFIEGIGYENGIFMKAHTWVHAGWGYGMRNYCNNNDNIGCMLLSNSIEIYELALEVYPNPTERSFHVNSDQIIKQVQLININGEIISIDKFSENSYNITDIASNGIYFLKIIDEKDRVQFVKIVKASR